MKYRFPISPTSDGSKEGIISDLTPKHGWSVADRGIVAVSSSSSLPSFIARHALDFRPKTYFQSDDPQNQWLCHDFKDRKVEPTHYSIHAHSWICYDFEGSLEVPK
jgi:hypothetical protein